MRAAKHSPGPWWPTDHGIRNIGGYIAHTNSVQRYEGQDDRYAFEVAQRDADKCLIAAAPELLEALRYVVAVYDKGTCGTTVELSFDRARRAIAKAGGAV